MRDAYLTSGAVVAGVLSGLAVLIAGRPPLPKLRWPRDERFAGAHAWLEACLRRAGWLETPQRIVVLTCAWAGAFAALALSAGLVVGPGAAVGLAVVSVVAAVGWSAFALRSAISSRREKLARELAPLLELFLLELSGGGSALSALGSVTLQLDCELAYELRRLLIASQVAGSASFESRLTEMARELRLPGLASLATVIAASRDYGTGVGPGVRALATDLRHAQRRQLIVQSRRALNHVLFPSAIGVLLPFLCILLFPAVTTLHRSLQ